MEPMEPNPLMWSEQVEWDNICDWIWFDDPEFVDRIDLVESLFEPAA